MKKLISILFFTFFLSANIFSQPSVPSDVEFKNFLSQADIFLLKGQHDNALSAYNSCLKLNPNSAATNFQISRIYFNYGDYDAALNYAKKSVELSPDNYWYNVFLAEIFKTIGKYSEAIKIYEKILTIRPNIADYEILADFYEASNNFSSAISTLNKIENIYGFNFDISMKKIELLKSLNRVSDVELEINKLILTDSSSLSYLGMLHDLYIMTSQVSKAQTVQNRMNSIDDKNYLSQLCQASLCFTLGQMDCFYQNLIESFKSEEMAAEDKIIFIEDFLFQKQNLDQNKVSQIFEQIISVSPNNFTARKKYADFFMVCGDFENAAKQLRICTSLDKSDFNNWRKLFKLYTFIEDYAGLKSVVDEAEEYFPEQVDLMLYSAVASIYLGYFDDAESMLQQSQDFGIELTESVSLFYFYSAIFNYKKKNFDLAFKNFDKFYNLRNQDLNLMAQYAYFLSDKKRNMSLAQNIIEQCLAVDNSNFYFYFVQAFYMKQTGDLKSAKYFIDKSINLNFTNKFYVYELAGDIYNEVNDCSNAVKNWQLAIQYGANSLSVNNKIKNCN